MKDVFRLTNKLPKSLTHIILSYTHRIPIITILLVYHLVTICTVSVLEMPSTITLGLKKSPALPD